MVEAPVGHRRHPISPSRRRLGPRHPIEKRQGLHCHLALAGKETRLVKRLRVTSILVLPIVFVVVTSISAQSAPQRIIIDTDPGTDDALAILLALNSPELKVEALTVVPGNVDGKQGLQNALQILSLAGRCDMPVAAGAQHPLNQKLVTAQYWHGRNGLADLVLPPSKCK